MVSAIPPTTSSLPSSTLAPELQRAGAARAAALLRALANDDRLLLLCQLSQGERSVGELERLVQIAQPMLSQHLAVLRAQDLVATRREGRRIYYRVSSHEALVLLGTLYALYCDPATDRAGKT